MTVAEIKAEHELFGHPHTISCEQIHLLLAELERLRVELAEMKSLAESRNDQLEVNRVRHINYIADKDTKIADLECQLAEQVAVNQTLWAALTPEKRHELNLRQREAKA